MKRSAALVFCILVLTRSSFGQSASVQWDLTTDQNPTTTVGNVVGQPQSLGNMQVSYSSSVQRSSPSGTAGSWPGDAGEISTRYMQFAVSPKTAYTFAVNSISMKLYVNAGSNMKANVYFSKDSTFAARTQISSTLTLGSTALSVPNVTASTGIFVNSGETFYVRIYPWYTTSTTGKYVITNSVLITGDVSGGTDPTIALSSLSLDNCGTVVAGNVSSSLSYSISGVNLVSNILVKAPAGFQVSADSMTFSDSLSVAQSAGVVPNTKIFVHFAPSSALGSLSGTIAHTSEGATTKTLDVSGIAIAVEPTTHSAVTFGAVAGSSIVVNFSGGNGSHRIVVAHPGTTVSWVPIDGSGVGSNSNYSLATDLGNGNKVVYNDTGRSATVTGLAVGTQYSFAVYEYNVDSSNSQNYLTTSPGTGNQTTLAVAGLSVNPAGVAFGNVVANTSPVQRTFSLSGIYLTPEVGTIVVASPGGFMVSTTSGANFASSVEVSYTGGAFSTTIYVQFAPALVSYNDTIKISGGGAAAVNVIVSGRGVSQAAVAESQPAGFASCGAGTTGGAGGGTVVVTTAQQLANIMKPREKYVTTPLIIYISGTLFSDSSEISVKYTANLSILGLGTDARLQGFGFKIWNAHNIVVRNISFSDCSAGEGDCISVESCNNVWIDHCSFTDSPSSDPSGSSHDGELDVKKESYNVTLSWNHFQNHRKTCLLGHSTSETGDTAMKVTYVHNWFDGTYSRHPRVRYARAHLLNNLYTGVGDYGVGSTCQAQILVEGNYFENTPIPTLISGVNDPGGTLSHDPAGYLKALNNYTTGSGTIVENTPGYNFDPSAYYAYSADDAQSVRALVMTGAGAGTVATLGDTSGLPTLVHVEAGSAPRFLALGYNYPNPFNPNTSIEFSVLTDERAVLKVYNILGQEVATLFDGVVTAGRVMKVTFDASRLSSGVYFSRLEVGGQSLVKRMMLMK